ncbi:MAG: LysR family transcriptional regulator [Sedimentibacter sp.]
MDYSYIETFLAIAETRSLTKAAERLFLSQSTVSYRLKVLEQEIGSELVYREQGKGFITLTVKGEEFIIFAQRWVSLLRDTELWKAHQSICKLNIGSVDSLNTCIFYELYKNILENNSPLTTNVSSHWTVTIHKMIESYELDIGFVLWQIPYKNIISKPLFSEKMVLISSSKSNFPNKVHPKDLDASKEVSLYCGPIYKSWHDSWWDNSNSRISSVDTVSLLSSFTDLIDNWSIVPISIAKKLEKSNQIVISEITEPPPERICYQITNKHPVHSKINALEIFNANLENFLKSDFFTSIIY